MITNPQSNIMNSNQNPIIYIAGPITGMIGLNKVAFDDAARSIKNLGFIVRNPHEFCADIPAGSDWHIYMRRCISTLSECTDFVLLPGWKHSPGANLELTIALSLGMAVHYGLEDFHNSVLQQIERRAV